MAIDDTLSYTSWRVHRITGETLVVVNLQTRATEMFNGDYTPELVARVIDFIQSHELSVGGDQRVAPPTSERNAQ